MNCIDINVSRLNIRDKIAQCVWIVGSFSRWFVGGWLCCFVELKVALLRAPLVFGTQRTAVLLRVPLGAGKS